MKYIFLTIFLTLLLTLTACNNHYEAKTPQNRYVNILQADTKVQIEGLGLCYDDAKSPIELNSKEPVTILVHGCYASSGEFKSLSQVLAFHGQQSFCFRYDDRDSLEKSARKLTKALNELSDTANNPDIHIIAHSMGGLIARKALIKSPQNSINKDMSVKMATVSTPFSGINNAKACANPYVRIGTLGIHDLACWMISGDKWYEITSASDFIQNPGELSHNVSQHILIATDERDSCRYKDKNGECLENDYVFSLNEQKLPYDETITKRKDLVLKAGHVEIVGKYDHSPQKLIQTLQKEGFIHETSQHRVVAFNELVQRLFVNKQL